MELRAATDADHDAVHEVVAAAFEGRGEGVAELVDRLRSSGHARAELVAVVDGALVGHVMLSHSWVDARERLVDVLVLSPLSVRPDRQGRGLGTALLDRAVAQARRLRAPALFLEGSPDYYGARGFEPATSRGFTPPSVRVPEPGFQVVVLDGHEQWMTGALVYCEPFWALDFVGLRDPELDQFERMFDS